MCFCSLLLTTTGVEIVNVTLNPGLLPIRLRPAKLVEGYHTITHYYDLSMLIEKIGILRTSYKQIFDSVIGSQSSYLERTDMFTSTINHTFEVIGSKIQNFKIKSPHNSRSKRGLIDGLGSLIKFVTGNLDAKDSEKYDKIISHILRNQENLQDQLESQYSINQAFSQNFNHTMEIINHNNAQIQKELISLQKMIAGENTHIQHTNNYLEHIQISLNLLMDLIQDIESSLTFCELGKLHPSILNSDLLLNELDRLKEFYGPRFLNHSGKDLFEMKSHIKVQCFIGTDEIVYFLDVPIVDPRDFDLYYLEPLPTTLGDDYVTIIPPIRYLLKSQNEVLALRDSCPSGTSYSLCPGHYLVDTSSTCESKFLQTSSTEDCEYAKLNIPSNYVSLLFRINQYLLVFSQRDTITIISEFGKELRNLQGIYLVRPSKNSIMYRNHTLFAAHRSVSGTPLLVSNVNLNLGPRKISEHVVTLRNLDLSNVKLEDWKPLRKLSLREFATPSVWSIMLYVMLISFICFMFRQFRRQRRIRNENCN